MSPDHVIKAIRSRLQLTQSALADELGVSQGNVSFYEKGQTIPPRVGERLIEVCAKRGLSIDFNHLYGGARLPAPEQPDAPMHVAEHHPVYPALHSIGKGIPDAASPATGRLGGHSEVRDAA